MKRNLLLIMLFCIIANVFAQSLNNGQITLATESFNSKNYSITCNVDKSKSRTNGDGTVFYAAHFTMKSGNHTYDIPDEMFIATDNISQMTGWNRACAAVDVKNDITYFYCFSKCEDKYYGMTGHLYICSNSGMEHHTVFSDANWGWHSFLTEIEGVGLVLYSFAYSGYYFTAAYEQSGWEALVADRISPDDFAEISSRQPAIYIYNTDGVEDEPQGSEPESSLIVWHSNGTITKFALDDEPVTTYSNGNLTITTNSTTLSLPLEEVSRYTYQINTSTAISNALKTIQKVQLDGDKIMFSQLTKDTDIKVYSTSGLLVNTIQAKAGQTTSVSLNSLPQGVYIVKLNGVTYKFLKK